MRRCCWLALIWLLGTISADRPAAQDEPPRAPSPPPAAAAPQDVAGPAVEASRLDTFLLRDSRGNLVPVLGMPFEEFEQLLRMKKGLTGPPAPSFTLDALSLAGAAEGPVADFQVTATVRVRQEGWVRVPLLMPTAIVRGAPKHEGPGEQFLAFDAAAGGYVCWLRGAADKPHVVTIQAAVRLSAAADESRLSLTLPRATESSLRLTLDVPGAQATLTGEGLVATKAKGSGQSEITVLGPAGDLQLAWRSAPAAAAMGPPQYDATGGEIQVRVDSQQSISSTAKLRIRSLNGPLETFQVRLPPGMELLPFVPSGYTLTPLPPGDGGDAARQRPAAGQIVEVRLDKPTASLAEVQIATTLQSGGGPAARLTPARFEVLGAVRQRGTIDFSVGGQWQLEWTEDASVRRLDLAADNTAPAGQVARFEYFKQPCGLALRVTPRPSRVSVEPTHVVSVDAQILRIKSTFKYKFRGSRASGLAVELGDWDFDSLLPGDLLETPLVKGGPAAELQVALRPEEALPAELELTLEAHRPIAQPAASIEFTLPRPLADVVAPATVIVSPADNVELTPQGTRIIGLSPDPGAVRIPGRQQQPLVYRDLGGGEAAAFAAGMQIRSRMTTVKAQASVRLDRQQMQVEQRLDYRIAHEPQRTFTLLAPRGLIASGNLQVFLGSTPLAATALPEPAAAGASAVQRIQCSAPTDQIGNCQLSIRYAVTLAPWDGMKPLPLAVPLVVPADESGQQFAEQQLDFYSAEGWQIDPESSGLVEFSGPSPLPPAPGQQSFTWSRAVTQTQWIVQPSAAAQQSASMVTKAWIQTCLSPRVRQERVVYRLTTAQESLRVMFPKGVVSGSVQAALDAQETPPVIVRETGAARIDLPPALRGREFTLELWYSLPAQERPWGLATAPLRPAQIDGAGQPRRTYWQLALPASEHLLAGPSDLAAEMVWSAERWPLTRQPVLDQRQLEDWTHASRQDPLPRGMRTYLFGTLGRAATMQIWTIHRRTLMAAASGGVLLLGLALLHWPALRRPSAVLALAVVLAGAALAAPDTAILVGQAAVLGLLVAAGAWAWNWLRFGRAPWPAHFERGRSHDSRPREAISTQPPAPRPEIGRQVGQPALSSTAGMEARP